MNMVTQETCWYPGATYQINSRQCPDPDLCVCFALFHSLESSQTIEVLGVYHAFSGQSTLFSQCFQRSWHFAIENIYTTLYSLYQCCFQYLLLKYSGHIKIGNDKGCLTYRHTSINGKVNALSINDLLVVVICYFNPMDLLQMKLNLKKNAAVNNKACGKMA